MFSSRLKAILSGLHLSVFAAVIPAGGSFAAECQLEEDETAFEVTITGVRNADGLISANLYGDVPDEFMKKGKWLERTRIAAQPGDMVLCLPAPGPGLYAVALFHDEDSDLRLSQNWIGLPKEGFGFSRDARAPLRLPHFEDAAVEALPGINALQIKLRY